MVYIYIYFTVTFIDGRFDWFMFILHFIHRGKISLVYIYFTFTSIDGRFELFIFAFILQLHS